MSGYDINRYLKSLGWLIGTPSYGGLYPALHTLLREGLVSVEIIPRHDRPSRKVYRLTEAGAQALQEWAGMPVATYTPLRAFLMRLILADRFTPQSLVSLLRQRQAQVAAQRAELERVAATLGEPATAGRPLAIDYGLALASAELLWLEQALDHLANPPPVENHTE